ncbi:hypothetical protein CIY_31800 [Butyrivibrio fibrisolvens 16/4]|nr:hypothetical protein CIY_31800 [Butyrivibrio fibrisolvens 16/4]
MLDNRLKILRQATFVIKQMSYRENKKKLMRQIWDFFGIY